MLLNRLAFMTNVLTVIMMRMAVGLGARGRLRADVAARAGLVFDDHRLVPALAQLLADEARKQVGPVPGVKGTVSEIGRSERPCASTGVPDASAISAAASNGRQSFGKIITVFHMGARRFGSGDFRSGNL